MLIRICYICGKEFVQNPRYKHDTQKYCSVNCQSKAWKDNNKEKVKISQKKYRENNKEKNALKQREWKLKNKYGITFKEYNTMLEKQNGACAICGEIKNETLAVDHNHKTGEIRGLLCAHCNHVIGFAKDNVDILNKIILYLNP
jgi:hypothetical protein